MSPIEQIKKAGGALDVVILAGVEYYLANESDWTYFYRREENIFRISKLQTGHFDRAHFEKSPYSLSRREMADAALSLFSSGDGTKYLQDGIPDEWQLFARKFCSGEIIDLTGDANK